MRKFLMPVALVAALNFAALSQVKERTKIGHAEEKAESVLSEKTGESQTEKAVASDAKPTVSFCVSEGGVRVRGWQRNEIRAYSEHGKLSLKVLNRNSDNAAVWLMVLGFDAKDATQPGKKDECLSGSDIEIEVPFGTSVDIKSREGDLLIESVTKARVQNVYGDVLLRDIREEAEISSLQGNVVAEDSSGRFVLKSSAGSVLANRLKPINPSDALIVGSTGSGNVTLQNVSHANIEAKTVSGELNVFGGLEGGGNYSFNTTTGAVTIFLPPSSSFKFNATMSAGGNFQTSFPIKTSSNNALPGKPRNVWGTYGAGESTINLTTFNGSLRLQKQ